VLTIKDSAAQLFYDRLFEIDPSLRGLFRGDMRQQGAKLMQVMDATVNGLSRLEPIVRLIEELGRRHVDYGVEDRHYDIVGVALLWTLGKSLRAEFTPEVRDAWGAVYGALATIMREAAAATRGRDTLPVQQPDRRDAP